MLQMIMMNALKWRATDFSAIIQKYYSIINISVIRVPLQFIIKSQTLK